MSTYMTNSTDNQVTRVQTSRLGEKTKSANIKPTNSLWSLSKCYQITNLGFATLNLFHVYVPHPIWNPQGHTCLDQSPGRSNAASVRVSSRRLSVPAPLLHLA